MDKGSLAVDPRGLIFESYRIDGISEPECRSIFLDWALGLPIDADVTEAMRDLWREYSDKNPDHPMNAVISEGLSRPVTRQRRGGRRVRKT